MYVTTFSWLEYDFVCFHLNVFSNMFKFCRYSMVRNDGRVDIIDLINGILGSLVSITAGCFLYRAWEAMLIGAIGAILTCITMPLFDKWSVDDPVGASSVHGVCGIWGKLNRTSITCRIKRSKSLLSGIFAGVIAVGLFADNPVPLDTTNGRMGFFKSGDGYLLGVQALSALVLTCWGIFVPFSLH